MDDYSVKHPKVWNIALCCGRCNTSRGPYSDPKGLAEWVDSAYCRKNNISRQTVAPVIRRYLGRGLRGRKKIWRSTCVYRKFHLAQLSFAKAHVMLRALVLR